MAIARQLDNGRWSGFAVVGHMDYRKVPGQYETNAEAISAAFAVEQRVKAARAKKGLLPSTTPMNATQSNREVAMPVQRQASGHDVPLPVFLAANYAQ